VLHTINQSPVAIRALRRIGAFQQLLLKRLRDRPAQAPAVDVPWVRNVWFRLPPDWVDRFCAARPPGSNKPTALECIRTIARASAARRRSVYAAFVNGQRVEQWFVGPGGSATATEAAAGVPLRKAVVNLLHVFYAPSLYADGAYNGYPPPIGDTNQHFHHQHLEDLFDEQNELEACPYCNGAATHRDLDHFVPLSRHPWLSCSPLNLIPVCKGCNLAKTTKPPWTEHAPVPTQDWFHPFLRSADGSFSIELRGTAGRPEPRMIPVGTTPVSRCTNCENLVKLPKAWKNQARSVVSTLRKELHLQAVRRGTPLADPEIRGILTNSRHDAEAVARSAPYSLVRRAICDAALADRPGYMQVLTAAAVP
jgi:hypothetical protein